MDTLLCLLSGFEASRKSGAVDFQRPPEYVRESMKNMKFVAGMAAVLLFAVAGFLYWANRTPFEERPPAVGAVAPRIDLADLSGEMVRMREFDNHVIILNFWASWCSPCKDQLQIFEKIYRELGDEGFTVIAIATDDIDEKYAVEQGLTYPVLKANDRVVREYGNINSVPATFLVDRSRRIIRKHKNYYTEETLREEIATTLRTPRT